ncbi:MAG: CHAT domain-containing protein [Rivularia sp. (in: Bacteria)]|nr:CHAT domain-containing protein [Rivularia sp. MS3]
MTSKLITNIALSFITILASSILPLNNAVALDKASNNLQNSYPIAQTTTNSISTEQIKQVAKNQNATLVQYSLLADNSQESELAIWVIKPTGDTMRRVDLKAWKQKSKTSLAELITKTNSKLNSGNYFNKGGISIGKSPQNKPISIELKKLHQVLIQPIANLLPKQPEERVIFIPQNKLFLVPFAALQDNKGKYLIEKHTISTAPSIQVLDLLHQRKIRRNNQKSFVPTTMTDDELLIVGNPTAPKVSLTKGDSCKPPSLPGAEEEAKNIAQIFKTQPLIGDAATETAIVQKMSQARIIHLATMTYPEDCKTNNSPGVIALASSNQDDGWLRTSEIQNLNLKADLVVLSACETALGRITNDGVIGLSRAFFTAGADSVIGSLWLVPDESTATLMTEFHANLSKNTDKASALRQAMLETMKQYPNPRDWAGFTLVGLL